MEDTIAAISTPTIGSGGIGIIRISGERAVEYADNIFRASNKKSLAEVDSHTINYGHIYEKNFLIDEVLVSVMRGPRSFTGEDVVEINCHGGMLVTQKILDTVIRQGIRLADPGEFTKRAFLNGRIDLARAEAVIDVINAKSEFALKASVEQLNGRISNIVNDMRDRLLDHIAFMEAAMDDPENIPMEGHIEDIKSDIIYCKEKSLELMKSFRGGKLLKDGITTVIIGRTNAGKSSLLNLLTGSESAIVTDIEGTTRDAVKERVNIGGITLNLVDTAGIRKTDDVVEAIGVEKALEHAANADLILYVIDGSKELNEEDFNIIDNIKNNKYITIINKSDLNQVVFKSDLEAKGLNYSNNFINLSTKSGDGLSTLEDKIKEMFKIGEIIVNDSPVITNSRHKNLLETATKSLLLVEEAIDMGVSEDLISIDLMDAYESLGKILGKEIEDDLADRIFEKFCMGK